MFRSHIELRLDARAVHIRICHRVGQSRSVADQLRHVLVAGGNNTTHAGFFGSPGECADDIIGFDTVYLQQGQAEHACEAQDGLNLLTQFSRHRRAVCFVLRVKFMPECRAPGVEDHGNVLGVLLLEQAFEHIGHTQ